MRCFDAHVHCGIYDRSKLWALAQYLPHVEGTPVSGAVLLAFPDQIYDRWNPNFQDSSEWRRRRKSANKYLLTQWAENFTLFPFFFIWNDFAWEDISTEYRGVKWHRHPNEPKYRYDDPRCGQTIRKIRQQGLPVLFEDELSYTVRFIREIAPDLTVIIPHMGFLNGGYRNVLDQGLFELPNVYTDTSLASFGEIIDYIQRFGTERIMFGSDFPFGDPAKELDKVLRLPISQGKKEAITGLNLLGLMSRIKRTPPV